MELSALSLALTRAGLMSASVPAFSPADLFTPGVNGVWYDPSDYSTLFQDAAGTLPVTAVEQPVGRMLDKSGRGNHAVNNSGNSANFPVLSARYNLLTGTEALSNQTVTTQATSYKLTFSGTGTIALSGSSVLAAVTAGTYTFSATAGSLIVAVVGSVTQADLRVANDALNQPAYQRVNTSTDYDTVGFKPYLRFNGTNQGLQTNSIDFTYGDKMFVCAGARKLGDAGYMCLCEFGTNVLSIDGSFSIFAPDGVDGTITYVERGTAIVSAQANNASFKSPLTFVASGVGSISSPSPSITLRVNGTQAAQSTASQGTGNFGNYPLYIGARAGNKLWFNGRLYQLIVAGKQASAAEITNTETFINQRTGAF